MLSSLYLRKYQQEHSSYKLNSKEFQEIFHICNSDWMIGNRITSGWKRRFLIKVRQYIYCYRMIPLGIAFIKYRAAPVTTFEQWSDRTWNSSTLVKELRLNWVGVSVMCFLIIFKPHHNKWRVMVLMVMLSCIYN